MKHGAHFKNHAPALMVLTPLIAGLIMASRYDASIHVLLAIAAASILASVLVAKGKAKHWYPLFLIGVTLTAWAYGEIRFAPNPTLNDLSLPPREVSLKLTVNRVISENQHHVSGVGHTAEPNALSKLKPKARIYFQIHKRSLSNHFVFAKGQVLQVKGVLRPILPDTETDFEKYLLGSGIHYRLVQTSHVSVFKPASPFRIWSQRQKAKIKRYLQNGAPEGLGLENIYIAMLLGDKTGLSKDQSLQFTQTGTMHLFAISGLHIGVMGIVIAQLLAILRVPSKLRPIIGLSLLFTYVEIIGSPPSAVRALTMVAFFWVSMSLNRQRSAFAALIASAILILVREPWQLWQIGFQLSYLVVASILIFGLPFHQITWNKLRPYKDLPPDSLHKTQKAWAIFYEKIWMLLCVSLAAWLTSAPLSASFFGHISQYAVLTNVLLVNLAGITITTGMLAIGGSLLGLLNMAEFLNHASWLSIYTMELIVGLSYHLPISAIECPEYSKIRLFTDFGNVSVSCLLSDSVALAGAWGRQ